MDYLPLIFLWGLVNFFAMMFIISQIPNEIVNTEIYPVKYFRWVFINDKMTTLGNMSFGILFFPAKIFPFVVMCLIVLILFIWNEIEFLFYKK